MPARYCGGNSATENGKATAAAQHRCPSLSAPATRTVLPLPGGNATVALLSYLLCVCPSVYRRQFITRARWTTYFCKASRRRVDTVAVTVYDLDNVSNASIF